MPRKTLDERFREKVARRGPDDCWPFLGATNPKGYGVLKSSSYGEGFAHRYALIRSGVDVPREMCVLHSCDNPPCCNPAHLRVGTRTENAAEMVARGRRASFAGGRNGRAKLTEADVVAILALVAAGKPYSKIAPVFGVSAVHVSRVARGERWDRYKVVREVDLEPIFAAEREEAQ